MNNTYIFYDIESYANYFIIGTMHNGTYKSFTDRKEFFRFMKEHNTKIWVGWNNSEYDDFVISYFMNFRSTPERMKEISDIVIKGMPSDSKYKAQFEEFCWIFPDPTRRGYKRLYLKSPLFNKEFDLMKWCKKKYQSLKDAAIALDIEQKKTPFEFDATISEEDKELVNEYCHNDLKVTKAALTFFNETGVVDVRLDYMRIFPNAGVQTPAKLAEELFLKYYNKRYNDTSTVKKSLEINCKQIACKNIPNIDKYMFSDNGMQEIHSRLMSNNIIIEKNKPKFEQSMTFHDDKGNKYEFGVGGLHTAEISGVFRSDEEGRIINVDAASFWPFVVYTNKLGTKLLPNYYKIMGSMLAERIHYKFNSIKKKADILKLAINSVNGKTGEKFSKLYSQMLSCGLKIHGELLLLRLWDGVLIRDENATLINTNTDGLMFKTVLSDEDLESIFQEWTDEWNIILEWEIYKSMIQSNVNNYFVTTADDKLKTKGGFWNIDVELDTKFDKAMYSKKMAISHFDRGRIFDIKPQDYIVTFTATKGSRYLIHPFEEHGTIALVCTTTGSPIHKHRWNEKKGCEETCRFNAGYLFERYTGVVPENLDRSFYEAQAQTIIDSVK